MSDEKSNEYQPVQQGQSKIATPIKIKNLKWVLEDRIELFVHSLRSLKKSDYWKYKNNKPIYYHVDSFCGTGYNDKPDEVGSPLVTVEVFNSLNISRFHMICADSKKKYLEKLILRIRDLHKELGVHYSPTRGFIELLHVKTQQDVFTAFYRAVEKHNEKLRYATGTFFIDPNGVKDIPWCELQQLSNVNERMDIVLHFNATANKRCIAKEIANAKPLREQIARINRKYWVVRQPVSKWGWSIIIGRNYPFSDKYLDSDFYKLDSEHGQYLLRYLDGTALETELSPVSGKKVRRKKRKKDITTTATTNLIIN